MAYKSLPIKSAQNQSFTTTLSVDGNNLTLSFVIAWNSAAGYWTMKVSDAAGNILIDSVPLFVANDRTGNLLAQHSYLKIGSAFLVKIGDAADEAPTADNLATDYTLIWGDTQ